MAKSFYIGPKKFIVIAICFFLVLSIFVFYMGYNANKEVEKTLTDQFNRQQLILARKIASNIRSHFRFLQTSLFQINKLWDQSSYDQGRIMKDLASRLVLLKDWFVVAIVHLDSEGKVSASVGEKQLLEEEFLGLDYEAYWQWGERSESKGKVYIGRTYRPDSGPFKGRWLVPMASPIYSIIYSEDGEATYQFKGLNLMIIDPIAVAEKYTQDIQSGETGYAWVIDDKGNFLAHYEDTFIGEESFSVRSKKDPKISYERIDDIMKMRLANGKEGVDWYISGWHRGEVGRVKKLLAYSSAILSEEEGAANIWLVGVTAPVEEVYGITGSIVIRQWIVAGIFQLLIFSFLAITIYFSLRWSQVLQKEVDKKTADLRASEEAVRFERDKVKESMARLVEAQEKLIRSERFAAIGQTASHLSHEIKNPLMLIGGFANQVEKSLNEDDSNVHKLRIIREEIGRLETMLTDVRDFTRPSKPKKELVDINTSIKETLDLLEEDFRAKGITYNKYLNQSLPILWFDPQQIKQVLINLIKNAAEAMPDGGTITVSSRFDEGFIWVAINDSGVGISAEHVEKVFDPFFTNKKKGTGLGLAVCRKIVEDHGGNIYVETAEGKGTIFTFSLPLDADETQKSE